jgi:hypothetical protein
LEEENMHEICEVCDWQDDRIQRYDPDYTGGANHLSLNQSREAFAEGKNILELERVIKEKYFAEVERARNYYFQANITVFLSCRRNDFNRIARVSVLTAVKKSRTVDIVAYIQSERGGFTGGFDG